MLRLFIFCQNLVNNPGGAAAAAATIAPSPPASPVLQATTASKAAAAGAALAPALARELSRAKSLAVTVVTRASNLPATPYAHSVFFHTNFTETPIMC